MLAQGGVWQALPSTQVGLNGLLAPRELYLLTVKQWGGREGRQQGAGQRMGGVTSFLTPLCLDSLPGPALPSPSRDCLTVQGRCFLLCTLSLQARCQLLLPAIPLPMPTVEGYGGWCWQASGSLPGQSCTLVALLSKNKCLTWTPGLPFLVLVPSLSPSSQSRHSEPEAAPSTMEAAGSHGES